MPVYDKPKLSINNPKPDGISKATSANVVESSSSGGNKSQSAGAGHRGNTANNNNEAATNGSSKPVVRGSPSKNTTQKNIDVSRYSAGCDASSFSAPTSTSSSNQPRSSSDEPGSVNSNSSWQLVQPHEGSYDHLPKDERAAPCRSQWDLCMEFFMSMSDDFYLEAAPGIKSLSEDVRGIIALAGESYQQIHGAIRSRNWNVFGGRARGHREETQGRPQVPGRGRHGPHAVCCTVSRRSVLFSHIRHHLAHQKGDHRNRPV